MSPGLLEVAETLNAWFSLTAPEPMPVRLTVCCKESSGMLTSPITSSVGASFTDRTVSVKLFVADAPSGSDTTTEMIVTPN